MFERPVAPAGETVGLFRGDDYPAEALARNEQGSVGVAILVDELGRVTQCIVTISSGSSALDGQTCRVFVERGKFEPARDSLGNPVSGALTQRITWRMTESAQPPMPTLPWHMRFDLTYGPSGEYRSCTAEFSSALPVIDGDCNGTNMIPAEVAFGITEQIGSDITVVILERWLLGENELVPEISETGLLLSNQVVRIDIGHDGTVIKCEELEMTGPLSKFLDMCDSARQYRFKPPVNEQGRAMEMTVKLVNRFRAHAGTIAAAGNLQLPV